MRLLFREFSPVLFSSFLVEFLRIFLRQVLMKERERESFYVLLFLSYLEISNRIAWAFLNANKLGEREEFSFRWFLFQIVYQRKSDRISVPLYLQYRWERGKGNNDVSLTRLAYRPSLGSPLRS